MADAANDASAAAASGAASPAATTPSSDETLTPAQLASLPPFVYAGQLQKKNDKVEGGKRATHRNWKPFHVELRSHLLVFYADEPDESEDTSAAADSEGAPSSDEPREEPPAESASGGRRPSKPSKDAQKKVLKEDKKRAERDAKRRATHRRARSEVKPGDFDEVASKDAEQKLVESMTVGVISVLHGEIDVDEDYVKEKRHVLRLITRKRAEYLLETSDENTAQAWIIHVRAAAGERAPELVESAEKEKPKVKLDKLNTAGADKSATSPHSPATDKAAKPDPKAEKRREKEEKERREKEERERKEKEDKERKEREERERKEEKERKQLAKSQSKEDSLDSAAKDKEKRGGFFGGRKTKDGGKSGSLPKDKKAFFGVPLHEQLFSDLNVPLLVHKCIEKIDDAGLTSVGMYRLAGSNAINQTLRALFDISPDKVDFSDPSQYDDDLNVIADCLKTYLRELPEPLMTHDLYEAFMDAGRTNDYDTRMLMIRDLVHALPEPNFATLQYLCGHLARVAANSEVNKMAPSNLAIVFGPNLLKPKVESVQSIMHDMPYKCTVVEALIRQPLWMFTPPGDDVHEPEEGDPAATASGESGEPAFDNLEQYNSTSAEEAPHRDQSPEPDEAAPSPEHPPDAAQPPE